MIRKTSMVSCLQASARNVFVFVILVQICSCASHRQDIIVQNDGGLATKYYQINRIHHEWFWLAGEHSEYAIGSLGGIDLLEPYLSRSSAYIHCPGSQIVIIGLLDSVTSTILNKQPGNLEDIVRLQYHATPFGKVKELTSTQTIHLNGKEGVEVLYKTRAKFEDFCSDLKPRRYLVKDVAISKGVKITRDWREKAAGVFPGFFIVFRYLAPEDTFQNGLDQFEAMINSVHWLF